MPGVESAGFAVTLPLNDGRWEDAIRRDDDPTRLQTFQNVVSPRYFDTMGIAVADGPPVLESRRRTRTGRGNSQREPGPHDVAGREPRWAAGCGSRTAAWRSSAWCATSRAGTCSKRQPDALPAAVAVVPAERGRAHPQFPPARAARPLLRRGVQALDQDLPVYGIKTLDEHVTATLTPQRLLAHADQRVRDPRAAARRRSACTACWRTA